MSLLIYFLKLNFVLISFELIHYNQEICISNLFILYCSLFKTRHPVKTNFKLIQLLFDYCNLSGFSMFIFNAVCVEVTAGIEIGFLSIGTFGSIASIIKSKSYLSP